MNPPATVPVWGASVRAAHWALALCIGACLVLHEGGPWHERLGYSALVLAAWRVALGFAARTRHLRFGSFVHGPAATLAYARALWRRQAPRHLGHNPLGGWMIVALLALALAAAASGALYATDRFWGDPTLYTLHQVSGWAFVLLVPLHVAGALLSSALHHENLVASMLDGRKRAPTPPDVGWGP